MLDGRKNTLMICARAFNTDFGKTNKNISLNKYYEYKLILL